MTVRSRTPSIPLDRAWRPVRGSPPRRLPAMALSLLMAVAATAAAASGPGASAMRLWVGFYHESPGADPDPTTGLLLACMPGGEGRFHGLMVFSFTGCRPGVDIGFVEGRIGPREAGGHDVTGRWRGVVDGIALQGTFDGRWLPGVFRPPLADGHHGGPAGMQGRWRVDGGGRWVGAPPSGPPGPGCGYHIAGEGHWRLLEPDQTTHGITIGRMDGGTAGLVEGHLTLGWGSPLPADAYLLAVIDSSGFCTNLSRAGRGMITPLRALELGVAWAGATDATTIHLSRDLPGVPHARVPEGRTVLRAFLGKASYLPLGGGDERLAVLVAGQGLLSAGGIARPVGMGSLTIRYVFPRPGVSRPVPFGHSP